MKFTAPIENFVWQYNISQMFGCNREFYRKSFGILAHNGLDIVIRNEKKGYGEPILAAHDGTVSKIVDSEVKSKGMGVYVLSGQDNKGIRYETVYWHLSGISVNIGQRVKAGQKIGLMGNSGHVKPTPNSNNQYDGTHLHFSYRMYDAQNRMLDTDNGFGGYKDPTPLMFKPFDKLPIYWARHLSLTGNNEGDDVAWLQTVLKLEGFAHDYDPTGLFGPKTLRDVIKLQRKYSVYPPLGYFGNKTRQKVKQYSAYY